MANLKVGIIGLGGIARSHCDAIAHLDNVEIVAVADLFAEKRQEYMEQYKIPRGYQTHHELLQDDEVEAVAIVLGHMLHHQLTIDACTAGKHVLVEKPMAINLQQCDEMIEAAANNNVKLMVGLSQHFYDTSIKAKEILDSGELGPVISAVSYMSKNWNYSGRRPQYRSRYHGGGMWLTNGVHVVDRLSWVMASQPISVSASVGTRSHYQAADDYGTALVRYQNGQTGTAVAIGYADGAPIFECQVICANGSLRFSEHGEKYVKVGKGEQWQDITFDETPTGMYTEWKSFAESIEHNIEPPTHGEYGRMVMATLFAAEESSSTGREVLIGDGPNWQSQTSGAPTTIHHGWI